MSKSKLVLTEDSSPFPDKRDLKSWNEDVINISKEQRLNKAPINIASDEVKHFLFVG